MIHLVTGHVGSGKTYFLLERIVEALQDKRRVFTNLTLAYPILDEKYPGLLHLFRDPIPMPDGEGLDPSFGEFEGLMGWGIGKDQRTESLRDGLIVLDEASTWFRPRYMLNEGERLFFMRQRHLGLDIYLATPDGESLSAAVRRMVNYHTEIENLAVSSQRIWGFIPPPPVRVRRVKLGYRGPVQSVSVWRLNPELSSYYSTTGGTYGYEPAEESRREPESSKKAAREAGARFVTFVLLLLVGAVFSFYYGVRGVASMFTGGDVQQVASADVGRTREIVFEKRMGEPLPRRGTVIGIAAGDHPIEEHYELDEWQQVRRVWWVRLPDGTARRYRAADMIWDAASGHEYDRPFMDGDPIPDFRPRQRRKAVYRNGVLISETILSDDQDKPPSLDF